MIRGIGLDMIEIARVGKAIGRERFRTRVYAPAERAWLDGRQWPAETAAGRFAAKEAVAKALGTGIGRVRWVDIAVLPDGTGRPAVRLYGEAERAAEALGARRVWVTITHDRERTCAVAVAEGDG